MKLKNNTVLFGKWLVYLLTTSRILSSSDIYFHFLFVIILQHVVLKADMFANAYTDLSGDLKDKISTSFESSLKNKISIPTGDVIGYIGPSSDRQGMSGGSSGHQG